MSPYENLLLTDSTRRIGLCAQLQAGAESAWDALAVPGGVEQSLARSGLGDLRLFLCRLPGRTLAFAYLTSTSVADSGGMPAGLACEPWWQELSKRTQDGWRRMEFINLVAHPRAFPHPAQAPIQRLGLVAGLRPASEALYRSLHQTNWPGVVDRMVRSHYRAWTTFLIDIGDELLLFTTVEYCGIDRAADDAASAADPVTRRWWRNTEPCLIPLLPGGGNWTAMRRVLPA
jgi:L-rhamnose mutarotase